MVGMMMQIGRADQRSFYGNNDVYGAGEESGQLCNSDGDDAYVVDASEQQRLADERRIYWESQEFLLQEILDQYSSSGSKFRGHIERHIDIARQTSFCNCSDNNIAGCIKCLRRACVEQLCSKGLTASLCTSKWKKTHDILGGSHEYIEVIAMTEGRRKQIPFLVELGFCHEFRMGKACYEYQRMVNLLPEIYIGKADHMNAIIRVLCEAAKKSSVEQQVHMGPWRKRGFMQMKWSASKEKKVLDHSSSSLKHSTAATVRVA